MVCVRDTPAAPLKMIRLPISSHSAGWRSGTGSGDLYRHQLQPDLLAAPSFANNTRQWSVRDYTLFSGGQWQLECHDIPAHCGCRRGRFLGANGLLDNQLHRPHFCLLYGMASLKPGRCMITSLRFYCPSCYRAVRAPGGFCEMSTRSVHLCCIVMQGCH